MASAAFYSDTIFFTMEAPSGAALAAQVTTTLNALGSDCALAVDALRS